MPAPAASRSGRRPTAGRRRSASSAPAPMATPMRVPRTAPVTAAAADAR